MEGTASNPAYGSHIKLTKITVLWLWMQHDHDAVSAFNFYVIPENTKQIQFMQLN